MPTTLLEVKGSERDGFEWVVFVVGGKDVVSDEVTGGGVVKTEQGQGQGRALLLSSSLVPALVNKPISKTAKLVRRKVDWELAVWSGRTLQRPGLGLATAGAGLVWSGWSDWYGMVWWVGGLWAAGCEIMSNLVCGGVQAQCLVAPHLELLLLSFGAVFRLPSSAICPSTGPFSSRP